jgi:hypothetical protein
VLKNLGTSVHEQKSSIIWVRIGISFALKSKESITIEDRRRSNKTSKRLGKIGRFRNALKNCEIINKLSKYLILNGRLQIDTFLMFRNDWILRPLDAFAGNISFFWLFSYVLIAAIRMHLKRRFSWSSLSEKAR